MKTKFLITGAIVGVATLGLAALRAVAEENYKGPSFELLKTLDEHIELRKYAPRIVAEVEVDDNANAMNYAFRILAAYIFGENKKSQKVAMTSPVLAKAEKISMTSPVTTSSRNQKLKMRFFMPQEYTIDDLPEPVDKRIKFIELPEETFASIRFSGSWRSSNFEQHSKILLNRLKVEQITPVGDPLFAYYNPPFMPAFLRHNEVLVPIGNL